MSRKLLGALLITAALVLTALVYLKQRRERIRLLEELAAALSAAAGELSLRALPLQRLFELLSTRAKGPAEEFFAVLFKRMDRLGEEDFFTLWEKTAVEKLPGLTPAEREEFSRLGAVLGRYELERQLEALSACAAAFDEAARRARQDYPDRRRLTLGLSACAGALLIIILI